MNAKILSVGLASVLSAAAHAAAERIGDWNVSLPAEAIRGMSTSERTCANRALKMNENGQHRSAVSEWKRFESEFVSTAPEAALAWTSFFHAYSLDRSNDRYKAIQIYSDTLELYPDSLASCAALFFRGNAYAANGNGAKALADYRELVDNQAFQKHPLAYEAHNRLAWSALSSGKIDEAVAEWRAVTALKQDANRSCWNAARSNLALLEAVADPDGKLAEIAAEPNLKPGARLARVRDLRNNLWGAAWGNHPVFRKYVEKHLGKAKNADEARNLFLDRVLTTYEKQMKKFYDEAGADWEYNITRFDMYASIRQGKIEGLVNDIGGSLAKTSDPGARSARAVEFIGRLSNVGRAKEAKLLLVHIGDPVQRAWTAVGLGWRLNDGKYIAEMLQPLEASSDLTVSDRAKREHARACQNLLRDYDTAIKLYEEAPDPPSTIWSIANCHRSAGRRPRAQQTLDEICSVFPHDAPQAMLTKGDWYRDDGDTKNAVGCYRRILAHAEWKKSGAASQAHQRLEAFGIATGGAMVNEVH